MDCVKSFDDVLRLLPKDIERILAELSPEMKDKTNEIRLRAGKPLMLCGIYGCCFPSAGGRYSFMSEEKTPIVSSADVEHTAVFLCGKSIYSHQDEINHGYIAFGGGLRAGICGTAVYENKSVKNIRNFTSVNIRLAKNINGCALDISRGLFQSGIENTVIFGPPLSGKTTVLKDLIRILSSSPYYFKTAVADERGELSMSDGTNVDFFCGYQKSEAIVQAVRTFSPQLIVADEIGTDEECSAVLSAMDCGVKFIVSVHSGNIDELLRRPLSKKLIQSGCFVHFVGLKNIGEQAEFYSGEELYAEINGCRTDSGIIGSGGDILQFKNEKQNIGA